MEASRRTYRKRVRWLVLALAVVAVGVPAAQAAEDPYLDAVDRYVLNNPGGIQSATGLDAVDRTALNDSVHVKGTPASETSGGYLDAVDRFVLNNRPLDVIDRWLLNHPPQGVSTGSFDAIELVRNDPRGVTANRGYDAVELVRALPKSQPTPATVAAEPGFDWADAGIGAGIAFGAMLLAAAAALGARSRGRVAHS